MKIIIKATNIELTTDLQTFIEKEINSLKKFSKILYSQEYCNHFFSKGKPIIEAWVEIGKISFHHQKGPFFWAECQMKFPKKSLRATAQRKNLKLAITEVKDKLQRELKEYKEKLITQTKRRSRSLKKELKLSPLARFWRKGRIKEEGI